MSADPLELFDRLGVPEGWDAPTDLTTDDRAAAILQQVFRANVVSIDRARRRRRAGFAGGLVIAVGLAGAAAAGWLSRSPEEARVVSCWANTANPPDAQVEVRWDGDDDPSAVCGPAWEEGRLGRTPTPERLTTCVTADDVAAVIPGGNHVCEQLGLEAFAAAEADATGLQSRVLAADAEFRQRVNPARCAAGLTPTQIPLEVQAVLDEYGLTGWGIEIDGDFNAAETCASVRLDPAKSAAIISPISPVPPD